MSKRIGRPTALSASWLPLVHYAGSVSSLAHLLGVCRDSLLAWGTGSAPRTIYRERVEAWCRRRGLANPWEPASKKRRTPKKAA